LLRHRHGVGSTATFILRRINVKKTILLLILLAFFIAGCDTSSSSQYSYQVPEKLDDDLAVGTVDEVGIDVELIASVVQDIGRGQHGQIHSLLIFKDGKLVFEEYFPGYDYQWDGPGFYGEWTEWDATTRHNVHSVGKSMTSACIGIAIKEGFIQSVDQSIFDYLPKHQHLNTDGKDQITIEHLLTMSSGLEWNEWGSSYGNESNPIIALWVSCDDPIACILEKPLVNEPGTVFNYSGGNMVLLGEIIKNATDMDIEAFSWQYLFDPLGIAQPPWSWINDEVIYAGGDQRLTPREMLKFGVTYLNQGVWEGQQIVTEDWVANSAIPYSGAGNTWLNHAIRPIPPGEGTWGQRGYSYSWWTHDFSDSGDTISAYWAGGWGSQKIFVIPSLNAVVVTTGANYNSADPSVKILDKYVIPAIH
jgi:CubicO group peptidase (beta-lactamase class C family)